MMTSNNSTRVLSPKYYWRSNEKCKNMNYGNNCFNVYKTSFLHRRLVENHMNGISFGCYHFMEVNQHLTLFTFKGLILKYREKWMPINIT
jgi:hypothetical protein